jgi:SAM-dependent methyltransferase
LEETHRHFIPAAGHDLLLPFYDPLLKLIGADSVKQELIDQAAIEPGQRILDVGCGTGTLAVMLKRLHPDAEVVGLDPDEKALARGRGKARREAVSIQFDRGYSDDLPYADDSFDHLFSSFMFHHLDAQTKEGTLREARRVLKAHGSLHLLDFGGSQQRPDGWLARLFHADQHLDDQFEGGIPALMNASGFTEVVELGQRRTLFGAVARYRATSPPQTDSARPGTR